ncbi:MAG: squalene synthase HpnC [Rhodoferax sp.]|nr:squalene synthase HpnC [Rhodoferax sp.]
MRPVNAPSPIQNATRQSVEHYENFPVASWLCPPRLRPPIAAIYHFARTADDLADEGNVTPDQRRADLADFRADLLSVVAEQPFSARWRPVFLPLAQAMAAFSLPPNLLTDLLDAFVQDVNKTELQHGYTDRREMIAYCQRSAAPIGRLLLHLYGVNDDASLRQSDDICNALQLVNFWQDLSRDLPRGRYYLPADRCAHHGVTLPMLLAGRQTPEITRLVAEEVAWSRDLMQRGAPLVHSVPGRAGWELRLVVQGGLRILDKIEALGYASLETRPRITRWDAPLLLARALAM